jgi:phage terminase small subunit
MKSYRKESFKGMLTELISQKNEIVRESTIDSRLEKQEQSHKVEITELLAAYTRVSKTLSETEALLKEAVDRKSDLLKDEFKHLDTIETLKGNLDNANARKIQLEVVCIVETC